MSILNSLHNYEKTIFLGKSKKSWQDQLLDKQISVKAAQAVWNRYEYKVKKCHTTSNFKNAFYDT